MNEPFPEFSLAASPAKNLLNNRRVTPYPYLNLGVQYYDRLALPPAIGG